MAQLLHTNGNSRSPIKHHQGKWQPRLEAFWKQRMSVAYVILGTVPPEKSLHWFSFYINSWVRKGQVPFPPGEADHHIDGPLFCNWKKEEAQHRGPLGARPTSCPSLLTLSLACLATMERNWRRRCRVSQLQGGRR